MENSICFLQILLKASLTKPKHKRIQVIENLKTKPEELKELYASLQQCIEEQDKEDQRKREKSNKTTKTEKYPTQIYEDPKEESEEQNGTVTKRSEVWNIEKVRLFRTWDIKERVQVMYAKSEYQPRGIPEVSRTTGTRRERQRRKELKEERGAQKDKRKNLCL